MEVTRVNAIMEQLDDLYVNRRGCNININHFTALFESEDEGVTNTSPKPNNTTFIVLIEDEDEDKNKVEQNKDDEKYGDRREKEKMEKTNNPNSED